MNLEKIFYIVASTVLVTVFVLIVFIFSPVSYDESILQDEKVIYYAENISPSLRKIIDGFNEKYKGKIRVETIDLSFDKFSTNERKELLARYLRSKSSRIDIFSVDIIWVPRFSRWAMPLNRYIDSSLVEDVVPHFLPTSFHKDSLVSIPLYADVALMFYRDDLLEKVQDAEEFRKELSSSITWERFIDLQMKVDAANGRVNKPFYLFQADAYEGLMCSFTELMNNHKNPMVASEVKLGEDDELSKKSIKFLVDLVHQYKISPLEVIKFKEMQSYQYFFEKDAFAVRGWPGFLSEDNKFFPKEFRGKVKAAPLPHLDGSSPAYVFGGWNLMVSKLSSKIQEVRIFIEYMLSDEIQKFHYEDGNVLPVKKSVYSDATFLKKHPELVFYQKLFENGIHRPMFERYTGLSDIIVKHINEAIEKNIEPGQVLQKIKNEIGAK